MTVSVTSLARRSTAALRAFARAQHVEVERYPSSVQPDHATTWWTYRRYLLGRVPLEGICRYYQTYDAYGDENDWNLNIAPDPAYAWMLDPGILYALATAAGSSIDIGSVKTKEGYRVIEAELTPDDGLYDKFTVDGLPIQSGGIWRDQDENQGEGPDDLPVGVYGVFCGDYGHGGRPEIHPFDAFWRRLHANGAADRISWDLGVFQDDSNRFNSDWSKPPIDVEFRIPFCLDMPVTMRTRTTRHVRFVLRKSGFCSVVAKNTRSAGAGDVTETFTAHTVRLRPNAENRVEVVVEDATGVAGRPFRLALEDVTYTTSSPFGPLSTQAWIAGHIVVRVAIDQDGYAYWNLTGPNSTTAMDAPDDPRQIPDGPIDVPAVLAARAREPRPARGRVEVHEVRPLVSSGNRPSIAAEAEVSIVGLDERPGARQAVVIRPRENPLVVDESTGEVVELESFDLFALALPSDGQARDAAASRATADIWPAIARLAGLERLAATERDEPATVEVDDEVAIDIRTRYAPFRDGQVQGEEQSRLSASLNDADTGQVEIHADVRHNAGVGRPRRLRVATTAATSLEADGARIEAMGSGHRLVVGGLGAAPAVVRIEATVLDAFGLSAGLSAVSANFRVVDALPWLERTTRIRLDDERRRLESLERQSRLAPTDRARSMAGLQRCLVDVLATLDDASPAPATRVAGAVRLVARVRELTAPARAS